MKNLNEALFPAGNLRRLWPDYFFFPALGSINPKDDVRGSLMTLAIDPRLRGLCSHTLSGYPACAKTLALT